MDTYIVAGNSKTIKVTLRTD
jgi:hypothetical protein